MLKNVDGAAYLKDYNFKMMPGTGPYIVDEADVDQGQVASRSAAASDYWAEKDRRNVGLNNFDEIRQIVVRDQNLAFEMFKKGDLDYYVRERRAQQWVEELNFDQRPARPDPEAEDLQRQPERHPGLALNTRKRALRRHPRAQGAAHLFNRELLIEKLFFNEYVPLNSYLRRRHLREPEQPEESVRPAAGAEAAGRSRLEGPRRAGTAGRRTASR